MALCFANEKKKLSPASMKSDTGLTYGLQSSEVNRKKAKKSLIIVVAYIS